MKFHGMGCEKSFVTIKLIWHTPTETGLRTCSCVTYVILQIPTTLDTIFFLSIENDKIIKA